MAAEPMHAQERIAAAVERMVLLPSCSFEQLCEAASCAVTGADTALGAFRVALLRGDDSLFRATFEGLLRAAAPAVRTLGDFLQLMRLTIWGSECLR